MLSKTVIPRMSALGKALRVLDQQRSVLVNRVSYGHNQEERTFSLLSPLKTLVKPVQKQQIPHDRNQLAENLTQLLGDALCLEADICSMEQHTPATSDVGRLPLIRDRLLRTSPPRQQAETLILAIVTSMQKLLICFRGQEEQPLEILLSHIKTQYSRLVGFNNASVWQAMEWLAHLYYDQCRLDKAEAEFTQLVRVMKEAGCYDARILDYLYRLGLIFSAQGRWADAGNVLIESVGKSKQHLPDGSDEFARWQAMARVYIAQEKWPEAEEWLEKIEASMEGLQSISAEDALQVRLDRVTATMGQGKWDEAEKLVVEVADEPMSLKEKNHTLAQVYLGQGRFEEARSIFFRNIDWEMWQSSEMSSEGDIVNCRNAIGLAKAYVELQRWRDARTLATQVVGMNREENDAMDLRLEAMDVVARSYLEEERWQEAEEALKNVIRSRSMAVHQGEHHPTTLQSMESLVRLYTATDRWEEAVELLRDIVEKWDIVCGPVHPQTFRSMDQLSKMYRKLSRWVEMDGIRRRMLKGRSR